MSIVESLLLYNPLEALVLILFCDIFTKRKFKKTDIIHCYILGGLNLFVQSIRYLFSDPMFLLVYDVIVVFIFGFILLYFYYFLFIGVCIKLRVVLFSHIFNYITICFVMFLFNIIFNNVYNSGFSSKIYELLANLSLRILQVVCLFIIKFGVLIYEKFVKKFSVKI